MIPEVGRSRCWRSRALAPFTRWSSAASPPTSSRPASTMRGRRSASRPRAASSPGAIVAYKPLLDRAIELASHKPERCVIYQRPRSTPATSCRVAISIGTMRVAGADAARLRAGGGDRSALHPVHVRDDRTAKRRRPRQRRPSRRAELDDEARLRRRSRAKCTGRRRTSAGWSVTPTSSMPRCSTGARRCSSRASPSARRTPARSGASSRSTRSRAFFTAPTAFRAIKREDPDGQLIRPVRPARACARCSSPASGSIPTRCGGPSDAQRAGHRSLVADGDRVADLRELRRPGHAAGQARLADQAGAGLGRAACSTTTASR